MGAASQLRISRVYRRGFRDVYPRQMDQMRPAGALVVLPTEAVGRTGYRGSRRVATR
jgi:hypothetical protein